MRPLRFVSIFASLLVLCSTVCLSAAWADYRVTGYTNPANAVTIKGPNGMEWYKNYSGDPPNARGGGSKSQNPPPAPGQESPADIGSVSCAGEITATIAYEGDASARPKCLIIKETATADWKGTGGGGADGLGGTAPNNGNDGNSCTTVRYSVVNDPAVSFTRACSPSANGSLGVGSDLVAAEANVSYKVEVFAVTVNLVGVTNDNGTFKVLTGQQVTASLAAPFSVKNDATTGKPMIQWTVTGGGVFKSYPYAANGQNNCHVQYHTADDWKQLSPGFFTKSAGAVSVSCAATLNFPAGAVLVAPLPQVNVTARALTSVKPTVTNWDIASGFTQDKKNLALQVIGFGLLGVPGVPAGQYWTNVLIDVPAPFSGGIGAFAQIITPNRRADRHLPTGSTAASYYQKLNNTLPGLDVAFPYWILEDASQSYTWNVPNPNGPAGDSPQQGVNPSDVDGGGTDWYSVVAGDTMTTWVMYLPPSKDSQPTAYVPLMNYSWGWSGSMSKGASGTWQFVSRSPQNTTQTPITQGKTATNVHPEWDRKHEYQFQLYPPQ